MKRRRALLVLAGLMVLPAMGFWLRTELRIDRCLDRGGRWAFESEAYEGARP